MAANAGVLLVHGLTFSERGFQPRERIQRHQVNRRAPLVLIVAIYVIYLTFSIPFAISIAMTGRVGTWTTAAFEAQSLTQVATSSLTQVSGMVLPPMIAYYVLWLAKKPFWMAILPSLPIIGLQVVMGTRFHFLFPTIGMAVMSLSATSFSIKAIARLAAFGFAGLILSVMMLRVRDSGIAAASWETLTTSVGMDELPSHEGTVETMAMLVQYFDAHGYRYGVSNRGILLFWIPRSLWPEKPTLLGYWFVRAYGMSGFGEIHNVAGSFAADVYADFGFFGGILFCGLIGFGFGRVERWAARVIAMQGHPFLVVACTLYGATFFAIRSLDTTIITMSGVVLLGSIFARMVAPQPLSRSLQHRHVASFANALATPLRP